MLLWQNHTMELHERLKAARESAGYETAALAAEAVGVPYPTYAGHENGSSGFRADKGEIYARKFKVRFEWLMRGRGAMVDAVSSLDDQIFRLLPVVPDAEKRSYLDWLRTRYGLEDSQEQPASQPGKASER